ncbi:MAG: DUF5591 domain-containing protein [Candidatus Methanofastidiosia archaeon]
MMEITYIDGMRRGLYTYKEKTWPLPGLITLYKDKIKFNDIEIEKPLAYPLRKISKGGELKSMHLLRVMDGVPKDIAKKIQNKNIDMAKERDVIPVYLSGYWEYDKQLVSHFSEAKLFLFNLGKERDLLAHYFYIRKKFPNSLCYCDCGPEELPLLAYAGFDLFPNNPENEVALQSYLNNPTPQYLEMASCASLRAKTLLNLLYLEFWHEMEEYIHTPKNKELYISRDAFWRPLTQRWILQVKDNYTPPSDICLVLPCSARKPYSSSQSHRRFLSIIKNALGPKRASLTQLIVTSPYGIVPRELETLIDYDIVVTGTWCYEEIERSRSMLISLLKNMKDPLVLVHLPENELDVAKDLPARTIITSKGHPLSNESLSSLRNTLTEIKDLIPIPEKSFMNLRTFSKFLYGTDILSDNIKMKGRINKQIFSNNKCIASYDKMLRPVSPLVRVKRRWVEIDFDIKGDLFCVGVVDADERIRPGDDVVITRKGMPVAIGNAILSGSLMHTMRKGKAVKVKRKIK